MIFDEYKKLNYNNSGITNNITTSNNITADNSNKILLHKKYKSSNIFQAISSNNNNISNINNCENKIISNVKSFIF